MRPFMQFRLVTVFLVFVPIGAGLVWVKQYLDCQPIEWHDYSITRLNDELKSGHIVLVNHRSTAIPAGIMHEIYALETPNVRYEIRTKKIIAMRANHDDESPESKTAWLELGDGLFPPVVALYNPSSPKSPIVLNGIITEQQVLDAIKRAIKPNSDG